MSYFPWTPRASIPRRYMSIPAKTHRIISWIIILYSTVFFLCGASSFVIPSSPQNAPNHSIAILLDTSLSMSATDVLPNRYANALRIATGIMWAYPAEYMTIPFSAFPLVRTPFSTDIKGGQQVLWQYTLWSYHTSIEEMGSAPWNAILFARDAIKKQPTGKKSIILLGDGSENTWYNITTFLPLLQQDTIDLFICAIGKPEYVLWTTYGDVPVKNALDPSHVHAMTQAGQGKRRVCNDVQQAINQITMSLQENPLPSQRWWHRLLASPRENTIWKYLVIGGILYIIFFHVGIILWHHFTSPFTS